MATGEASAIRLFRDSQMGVCLDQALSELSVRHGLSTELHEDTMAQFDHDMLAALERHSGPPITIRGRIVTFKHYLSTWHFSLQPGYATWDKPSNVHSWVRFERLRLVLADKAKVDELRIAQTSAVPVPPPSPPPPSPPPSPPRPAAPPAAVVGDESESDDGRQQHQRAPQPQPRAAPGPPVIGDESDDDDGARRAGAALAGQKRPRGASPSGAHALVGDEDDEDDEAGAAAPPPRAQPSSGVVRLPQMADDELGSDDDLPDEELATLLDSRSFADAPCVRALYSKCGHKREVYKFELQAGSLCESSRVHLFAEGKCELDFVEAAAYDQKLKRMGML